MALNIFSKSFGNLSDEGFATVNMDAPASEIIQDEVNAQEFGDQAYEVQEQIVALEDANEVVGEMEDQAIQNEVNLAAVQGEEVPTAETTEAVTVETEGGEPVVTATAEEIPAPTIDQNSSPEEIAVQTQNIEAAVENFAGRLMGTRASALYDTLGVYSRNTGIESFVRNPIQTYAQGVEGFKDTLVAIKNKVLDVLQRVGQFIVKWFRKFVNACKMVERRAKSLYNKLKEAKEADFEIKDGEKGKNVSALAAIYLDNGGKNAVSSRVKEVEGTFNGILSLAKEILKGTMEPSKLDEEAAKKYRALETSALGYIWKGIKKFFGAKVDKEKINFAVLVDNGKIYGYSNKSDQKEFPRLESHEIDSKQDVTSSVSTRLNVAKELANSVVTETKTVSKKIDEASKAINDLKTSVSKLASNNKDDSKKANYNYAFRRSISVATDLFKLSAVYGLIPSQTLAAAHNIMSTLEKK